METWKWLPLLALVFFSCATPQQGIEDTRDPAQVRNDSVDPDEKSTSGIRAKKSRGNFGPKEVKDEDEEESPGGGSEWAKGCGDLYYGEDAHSALSDEDSYYFLHLDCDLSGSKARGDFFVKFPRDSMIPQRRGVLTGYRRAAIEKEKSRRAAPLVCFRGQVSAKLCDRDRAVVARRVDNFTIQVDKFRRWEQPR